jgi:hypothetical protein
MYAIKDITSRVNIRNIYANKGDKVEVIADYGHFCIVELKGNRFSTLKENLTNDIKSISTDLGKRIK